MNFPFDDSVGIRSRVGLMLTLVLLIATPATQAETPVRQDAEAPSIGRYLQHMSQSWEPSRELELLGRMEGEWRYENRIAMPGMVPFEGHGDARFEWVMGGRYLQCAQVSQGEPRLESMLLFGYDDRRGKERFFLVGLDNLGTYVVQAAGKYDEDANQLVLRGEDYDPETGGNVSFRQEIEFIDEDRFTVRIIFDLPGLGDQELGRIEYRRKAVSIPGQKVVDIPSPQAIGRMNGQEARAALTMIGKLRHSGDLSDSMETRAREAFMLLLERIRELSRSRRSQPSNEVPAIVLPDLEAIPAMDAEQVEKSLVEVRRFFGQRLRNQDIEGRALKVYRALLDREADLGSPIPDDFVIPTDARIRSLNREQALEMLADIARMSLRNDLDDRTEESLSSARHQLLEQLRKAPAGDGSRD